MPRSRALRRTVEMPARFSTDTAIASTRRVIQLSTSSFCRAASSPVGPSQISSTPSCARGFFGAGAATHEVRIALRLRHHRDDGTTARSRRRRRVAHGAASRAIEPSRRSCRPRGRAPARMAAQRIATWLFLTSVSPSRTSGVAARRRPRRVPGSSAIAAIEHDTGQHARELRSATRRAATRSVSTDTTASPRIVPPIVPRPPVTDAPPSTTAVIAASS